MTGRLDRRSGRLAAPRGDPLHAPRPMQVSSLPPHLAHRASRSSGIRGDGEPAPAQRIVAICRGHSSKPAALVLVDVASSVSHDGRQRIADVVLAPAELDALEAFVERAKTFNPARDERLLRRSLLHNRQLPKGAGPRSTTAAIFSQETFEKIRASQQSLTERLPSITCPALVVRGAESDVLSEADAERFADALPDGHSVPSERGPHRGTATPRAAWRTRSNYFLAAAA